MRSPRGLLMLIGAAIAWPLGAAAQAGDTVTLAQAVAEALTHNERLVNQRDVVAQADLGLRLARSAFRPRVTPNIFGSFGRTDVNSQTYRVDVSQRLVTGTELRLSAGTASAQIPGMRDGRGEDLLFYNADTTLTLTQPLLRGFGRSVARRALTSAEWQRADADRQQTLAEQQVAVDVAAAYYAVVAQESFVEVARRSLQRSRRLREASELKLDAGLVSQLDVLRSQQLVAQAELQLFDAQSAVEDARDHLAWLMGRPADRPFEVAPDIPAPDADPIDAADAAATALANRLDLKSRAAASADADNRVRFSRNQLLPQVDVNFALTRRETSPTLRDSFGLDGYQFATFFTIAMPVDRTAEQVEFQSAVLDRDRRRRDVAALERQIANDVKQAVRERDRQVRGALAAGTSVTIGRRELEVAELRFQNGLSNNLDVVSAESALLAAEGRQIQAAADAALASLRLKALLGILDPRTGLGNATP